MAYLQSLRSHADLSVQITPPRAEVKVGEAPLRGTRDGIVTLIEFADYECPYCQQIAPELARIETEYKGRLAFVYKDFPLPMHPHAQKAAEAALCAGEQNKYWEYHDLLLSSKKLDTSDLKESAQQVGLDTEGFNSCIDSGRMAAKVRANLDEATQLGLTGTPAFLLNGRLISGSMSYDQLHQLFEDEIKASVRPATAAAQQ